MLARIVIFALFCSLLSCKSFIEKYKRSSSGVSELDKKVLYDFRSVEVHTDGHPAPAGPAGCTPVRTIQGSFTYAAEQEDASLYRCSGENKLIVYSTATGKMQATSDTAYADIIGSFDLNKDDKNELLLTGETNHDGVVTREASLDTFEKNSLRAVEDFGIVYTDPCAKFSGTTEQQKNDLIAKGLSPYIEAVRIVYLPRPGHEMPSFTAERLRAACPTTQGGQPGPWQVVSGK